MSGDLNMIGADVPRAILIRVKNAGDLAAKQGGAAGSLATKLVPQFIENTVLEKIRSQLASNLEEKGVSVDVQIVTDVGQKGVLGGQDLVTGLALGTAGAVSAWALWRFFLQKLFT